jgi:glutathione S-transferase
MGMPDENIHPHATGAALETVNAHQEPQDIVFWSGWCVCDTPERLMKLSSIHNITRFCPFNQRSWISLEEKGIPYQYKEVNPYKKEECASTMFSVKI